MGPVSARTVTWRACRHGERVDEAGRLKAVDLLGECAMEEGVGDVKLVHRPTARCSEGEHRANRCWLDDRRERLAVVDAGVLAEAAHDPPGLVPLQHAVGVHLVLEEPLVGDEVGTRRPRHQRPCSVANKVRRAQPAWRRASWDHAPPHEPSWAPARSPLWWQQRRRSTSG